MDISLNIFYSTNFGEELVVNILSESSLSSHRMTTHDGKLWTCNLKMDIKNKTYIEYFYSVIFLENSQLRSEWKTQPHRLEVDKKYNEIISWDKWMDIPEDLHLYSSAFTKCVNKRKISPIAQNDFDKTIRIKVHAPKLRENFLLFLVGDIEFLGSWNPRLGLKMVEHNHNEWVVDINVNRLYPENIEFKFVAIEQKEDGQIIWEEGQNRSFQIPKIKENSLTCFEFDEAHFEIDDIKCAGTLVPLFSLRSYTSFGIGDFGDLKKMIDFIALTSQRILQILPINDTTVTGKWTDSYPYCPTSVFALHPIYADLEALPKIQDKAQKRKFETLKKKLNVLDKLDYERVYSVKNQYLRILFSQEGEHFLASQEFKQFFKENSFWLAPYAQYNYLREKFLIEDFSKWPSHRSFNEKDLKALENPKTASFKNVAYYYFVQFILYSQMTSAHEYAREKGVILKGDVPIGVNRLGCDVWQNSSYFNLDCQTGAPPDDFAINGQNWGFPTYNWEELKKDGLSWWKNRFKIMSKFFDAYRIDHVLGFFRIWEIPINAVNGLLGQFSLALGLTRSEIEASGLKFDEKLFLEPYITDEVLEEVFKEKANIIRNEFLESSNSGFYYLKPQYDSERKVEAEFYGKDTELLLGLYRLINDVLFIRDHRDEDKFHPRITAKTTFIYKSLSEEDKEIFDKIYEDYFYHRNTHFWYLQAMSKLPEIIQSTSMLTCAEDLGMIPESVPWVMNELKMLSLEMQSMPKALGLKFGLLSQNPYRSVCMISSHDTPTLRGWWDEDEERTQSYYNSSLHKYGYAPHPLPGWLAKEIIQKHLACPSMLCVVAIQDWMATNENIRCIDPNQERVNIPANPHHYWRYRMHIPIEDLISNKVFCQTIKDLIIENKRT